MSSPRDASPCEAVIVHVDPASPDASETSGAQVREDGSREVCTRREASANPGLRHGTLRRGGGWPGGPLRLPLLNQAEFVQEFNQLYRSLGMRLEVFEPCEGSESEPAKP